ncbi:MAG TPA: GTPase HflX [Bacillota bacterium]|nr:GTPase HflX [Bacillota bacterium]HPL53508.1 GTPase HflX [Bacillota bacterium]
MNNTSGIKKSLLIRLENLKNLTVEKHQLVSKEIIAEICDITEETGREIAVYIDRKGAVIDVGIGDVNTVTLKAFNNRRSEEGLSGIRCVHTHPEGSGRLSDVDLSALKKMRFDIMAAVGVSDGLMTNSSMAFLGIDNEKQLQSIIMGPYVEEKLMKVNILDIIAYAETGIKEIRKTGKRVENDAERAVLVGIEDEEDLDELMELLKTAGGFEVGRMVQSKDKKDTAFFIGRGKLKELKLLSQTLDANLVIFDEELSGAQIRNLEEALGLKVIDRTQLILDIFAQRARSKEGKLQVELAQLKYAMPRLAGMGQQMSRTGGGIGTRGPGEKKLEVDRRRIKDRINILEKELKEIEKHRNIRRRGRTSGKVFQICLVGYTNSGKSTLLNNLANADIYAEDRLFATLDPTIRKVTLHNGKEVLIADTVGFIRKLPHELIKAFKSTLEEVLYADLLIHMIDGSNPDYDIQAKVAMDVLAELGAGSKDMITAINKIDKCPRKFTEPVYINMGETVFISALYRTGLPKLLALIEKHASMQSKTVEFLIPYTDGSLVSTIHGSVDKILLEQYRENGIYIKAEADEISCGRFKKYMI